MLFCFSNVKFTTFMFNFSSIPLTNSTIHNTKLNRSVPDDSKMSCFYRSRSFNHSALSPKTKSFLNPPVKPDDSAYDKVVNVIDRKSIIY